jgi:hypothetical protein
VEQHVRSPLELPAWLEFNQWRWGFEAVLVSERDPGRGSVHAVLYLDRRGRIVLPHTNAFLPVRFESEGAGRTAESTWLAVGDRLAEHMRRRHVQGRVILPPNITDVRPLQWRGFSANVVYTYLVDLPFDPASAARSARRRAKKAVSLGLTCERSDDFTAIAEVLAQTERRQGFSYGISASQLQKAGDLLGRSALRTYLCRDAEGRAASSRVVLHAPGAAAVDWLAGTGDEHLTTGATQSLINFVLHDLGCEGATAFDFAGANLPSVARAKSHWGGRLTAAYAIDEPGPRTVLRAMRNWWQIGRPKRFDGSVDD